MGPVIFDNVLPYQPLMQVNMPVDPIGYDEPCASFFFFSEGACYGLWQQAGCVFFFSVGEGRGEDQFIWVV